MYKGGKMNKEYQVLVWEDYEYNEQLGQPKVERDFDTYEEAYTYYKQVEVYLCKMIMRYENELPEADSVVICEDWGIDI